MKRNLAAILSFVLIFTTCFSCFRSFAETKRYTVSNKFSYRWYQTEDDVWHIEKDGVLLKNTWILDDECDIEGGLWYLIDEKGDMVSDPLIVDGHGRYYSFQQEHDGHFGTMRVTDGVYYGVTLKFSRNHDGSYGSIINPEGVEALKAKTGIREIKTVFNPQVIKLSDIRKAVSSGSSDDPAPAPAAKYYTLSYDLNGVTPSDAERFKSVKLKEAEEITKPATPSDADDKKEFVSWYGEDGIDYDFESTGYLIFEDTTLFARWKEKAAPVIPLASVSLDKTELTITVGDTYQLNAIVLPENAENRELDWKTSGSRSSVVEVDQNGELTALQAGTVSVIAGSVSDPEKTAACTVTVVPVGTIVITADSASKTYDGTALTDSGYSYTQGVLKQGDELTAAVSGTITNAGTVANEVTSYKIMRGSTDVTSEYTVETADGTLTVEKIKVNVPHAKTGLIYNGSEQEGVTAAAEAPYSLTDNKKTDAGNYTANAALTDKTNFEWDLETPTGKDQRIDWCIAKASYDMSGVSFDDSTVPYDGQDHSLFISGSLPAGVSVSYEGNGKTAAGEYTVTAKFSQDAENHVAIPDKTAKLAISRKKITKPVAETGLVYDGTTKTGVAEGTGYTISGNTATNAGSYLATAKLERNYRWSDGTTTDAEIGWGIAKASYDMSGVSFDDSTVPYDGQDHSLFISGSLPAGVTVSYEGNGKTAAGEYTVTAKFTGDASNYEEISNKTAKLIINPSTDCLAAGTRITMADGSFKNIEEIKEGDKVLTFNHEKGVYEAQKVYLAWKCEEPKCAFTLNFTNNIHLSVVGDHNLFEKESLTYAAILENNAEEFIGRHFYNAADSRYEELLSVTFETEPVEYYEIYTEYNANCIAESMLNVPFDASEALNIYKFNEDLTIDQEQLAKDIAEFGLLEYPENAAYSRDLFEAVSWKYVYIMIGKGFGSWDDFIARRDELLNNY